jgi:thiol-disulfide isomerase/thioredoxin
MKVIFLYGLLLLLSAGTALQAAIVIKGHIKTAPKQWLTISGYADYVSGVTTPAAQVQTDTLGNFEVRISDHFAPRVKLEIENRSLAIYVLKDGEYAVSEEADQLSVKDIKGIPLNRQLSQLVDDLLKNWYPLFLDSSGEFRLQTSIDTILTRFRQTEEKYLAGNAPLYNDLIHYQAAYCRLEFLHLLRDDSVWVLLNVFEREYFDQQEIKTSNPFYMQLLQHYMEVRINSLTNRIQQPRKEADVFSRILPEADYFKNDLLRQWAIVAGCKLIYPYSEGTSKQQEYADRIRQYIFPEIRDTAISATLERVLLSNNKIKTGDPFPILTLKNEKGEMVSLADIQSELILVDFWGTWCWGCIEGMKNFQSWMEQCNGKLTIVSIAVDDQLATMTKFLDKRPRIPKWVTLYNGREGNYLNKLVIRGYPAYFLLNRNKEIIAMPGLTSAVAAQLKAAL